MNSFPAERTRGKEKDGYLYYPRKHSPLPIFYHNYFSGEPPECSLRTPQQVVPSNKRSCSLLDRHLVQLQQEMEQT